jgi:hypothetical protein
MSNFSFLPLFRTDHLFFISHSYLLYVVLYSHFVLTDLPTLTKAEEE